jgi:hypothetical protein
MVAQRKNRGIEWGNFVSFIDTCKRQPKIDEELFYPNVAMRASNFLYFTIEVNSFAGDNDN